MGCGGLALGMTATTSVPTTPACAATRWDGVRVLAGLLAQYSRGEVAQHPWRTLTAVLTIALGVALALAVHLINASALAEFSKASGQAEQNVQSLGRGEPMWWLNSATNAAIDPQTLARLSQQPNIHQLLPEVLANVAVRPNASAPSTAATNTNNNQLTMQLRGLDGLAQAQLGLTWLPTPNESANRLDLFAPDAVFANPAALQLLTHNAAGAPSTLDIKVNTQWLTMRLAGTVRGAGAPVLVMDVAAAQALLGMEDKLTRIGINLRKSPATGSQADTQQLLTQWRLGSDVYLQAPQQEASRLADMTRAYRVNLSVLALVALFTGAFLVFSVLSLSVAKRLPQFALLGVLGLSPPMRMALVLTEAAVLGLVGSSLGALLAVGLASLALQFLGGDLGSGMLASTAPHLQLWANAWAIAGFMALGMGATVLGAWWPARSVAALAPAMAIKGLYIVKARNQHRQWAVGVGILATSAAALSLPPVWDIPLGAYVGIALLLLGAMVCLPLTVATLLARLPHSLHQRMLPMLALSRAQRVPYAGAVAISGVVTSLALAVALTVMVASFRGSVTQWLNTILPADIYLQATPPNSTLTDRRFEPSFVAQLRTLPGIDSVKPQHVSRVTLNPAQAPIAVIARDLALNAYGWPQDLPPAPASSQARHSTSVMPDANSYPVWVSEALRDTYQLEIGQVFAALQSRIKASDKSKTPVVAGVWRDYARQSGSVVMQLSSLAHTRIKPSITDIAVSVQRKPDPDSRFDATLANVQQSIRAAYASDALAMATTGDIRNQSLRIFDRSFAVTNWLQMVAIGIGLFGVATSVSAQVLARQREFGLLAHLGLTPKQVQQLVSAEALFWSSVAAAVGLGLGLVVSAVLVFVVNPQSFHWTMDWQLPAWRLLALCAAVVVCGTATSAWVARRALNEHAVQTVKQDW